MTTPSKNVAMKRKKKTAAPKTVRCENCDEKIPQARLAAMPGTTFCVKCVDKFGPQVIIDPDSICAQPSVTGRNGFSKDD